MKFKFLTEEKKKDINDVILEMDTKWQRQNNKLDNLTRYIYDAGSLKDLNMILDMTKATNSTRNYAYHRWFNYLTSKMYEEGFAYYGAQPAPNEKDHDKDFFIDTMPYDLKVTVLSDKYQGPDIHTEEGKVEYIKWLYQNQSRQQRFHLKNRLFLVCCADSPRIAMLQKAAVDENLSKVKEYLDNYEPHKVVLDSGVEVYSDIIVVD
jgi:hypothetical protein